MTATGGRTRGRPPNTEETTIMATAAQIRSRRMLEHPAVQDLADEQRSALEGLANILVDADDRHHARSMAWAFLCGYGADLATMRAFEEAL